ncbi:MAG: CHAT domain-containing tetratricopeptide repeat protein [Candidatus Bipolaricaulia bacterium]
MKNRSCCLRGVAATLLLVVVVVLPGPLCGSAAQETTGRSAFDQAALLLGSGSPYEALGLFELAASLYAQEGNPMGFVNSIFGIGECLRMAGDPKRALTPYNDAYAMAVDFGYTSGAAMAAMGLGACHEQMGDCATAIEHYSEARDLYESIDGPEAMAGQAQALCKLGDCARLQGLLDEAMPLFEEALALAQAVGFSVGEVEASRGLGDCLKGKARFAEALEYYDRGLAIAQAEGYTLGIANTLLGGADCLKILDRFDAAYERFGKASAIYRTIRSPIGEAQSRIGLGETLKAMGLYAEALAALEAVHDLCVQTFFPRGSGMALWGIGDALALLGRPQEALEYLEQSLQIFRSLGDALSEANARYTLGKAFLSLGDDANAMTNFTRCLDLYDILGAPQGRANTLLRMADHLQVAGLCALALEYYALAEPVFDLIEDPTGRSQVLAGRGRCQAILGDLEGAESSTREALAISESVGNPTNIWACQFRLADVYHAQGKTSMAVDEYRKAVETLESIAGSLSHEGLRTGVFRDAQAVYRHVVQLLVEDGQGYEALVYAERARGRTALDILARGATSSESIAGVEGLTASATVDAAELSRLIDAVPAALEKDECVLLYAWGTDNLFLWTVTHDGMSPPIKLPTNAQQTFNQVYELRSLIEKNDPEETPLKRAQRRQEVQDRLRELYELLVSPATERIRGKETVIVVPSGPLWYIPFAALKPTLEQDSYLLKGHAVAFVPSLASIPLLVEPTEVRADVPGLGIAIPDREDVSSLPAALGDAVLTFLQAIGGGAFYDTDEATETTLNRVIPRRGIRREDDLEPAGKRYEYIVFGCHGQFSYDNPLYSRLVLGRDEQEDGDLYASEVLQYDLAGTELVILLACETFLVAVESRAGSQGLPSELEGQRRIEILEELARGDELVGLARSFLLAGAKGVLATHWEVSPHATSRLALALGESLEKGTPTAQALQAAQLQLLGTDAFADPWFWAPFQLIGSWR